MCGYAVICCDTVMRGYVVMCCGVWLRVVMRCYVR